MVNRMKLHIHQARGVVCPLQKRAQSHEIQRLVHQHGADGDATRQVRAELDPFKELRRVGLKIALLDHAFDFQPGLVLCFPHLGGEGATHSTGVLAGRTQARQDAGRVFLVLDHELHHLLGTDHVVFGLVSGQQLTDGQQALPARAGHRIRLRQEVGLVIHIQQAGRVFGALGVAIHPEKMVGGS